MARTASASNNSISTSTASAFTTSPKNSAWGSQDPETLAACFGRKNKKRTDQITGILATLKALGHIV